MNIGERISDHINKYLRLNRQRYACECEIEGIRYVLAIHSLDENDYTDIFMGAIILNAHLTKPLYVQYIEQTRTFNNINEGVRLPIIPEIKFNKLIGKKATATKTVKQNKLLLLETNG